MAKSTARRHGSGHCSSGILLASYQSQAHRPQSACRTALLNFTKSYLARADPLQQARKERYAKHRRRWARKDLKQKRRAKAASDPAFGDQPLHPTALHIDYMSSEYSSAGEDSDGSGAGADGQLGGSLSDKIERRAAQWADVVQQATQTASSSVGWAEGLGEKVLEVRTPLWRSPQVSNISSPDGHAEA